MTKDVKIRTSGGATILTLPADMQAALKWKRGDIATLTMRAVTENGALRPVEIVIRVRRTHTGGR